jgi:hypothetical protein
MTVGYYMLCGKVVSAGISRLIVGVIVGDASGYILLARVNPEWL